MDKVFATDRDIILYKRPPEPYSPLYLLSLHLYQHLYHPTPHYTTHHPLFLVFCRIIPVPLLHLADPAQALSGTSTARLQLQNCTRIGAVPYLLQQVPGLRLGCGTQSLKNSG
jgi:hypothetical protein